MFSVANVRDYMAVLVRGGSPEAITYANNCLVALQSCPECWTVARELLADGDPGVQTLSSQLFYNKTRFEWAALTPSHQLELRDFLLAHLRTPQLAEAALKKIAQTLAFVSVNLATTVWQSAFEDILTLFPRELAVEVLSSVTLALRDSSEAAGNDQVSSLFLRHQEPIFAFLEQCMRTMPIKTVADILMDLCSCGFTVLKHPISALLVEGLSALSLPAIDILIVAIAKSSGGSEIHKRLQAADSSLQSDLLGCYDPIEIQSLRTVGAALGSLASAFRTLGDDVRKKLCDLVCSFCSDHLFLLLQNEGYSSALWSMLIAATEDSDTEVACLAIGLWSDVKSEVLKAYRWRAEVFNGLLESAGRCGLLIATKCCFPSMDFYQAAEQESHPVHTLRKSSEDSLYSLLCIFSEANKAQVFLETFLPLLDSQNPLHLELFLFVMRSMGLELESDKNRSYIGNLLTHFMKKQHPVVTRATLLFISEVSSTIKKIPGLLNQTLFFANEQIQAEAAAGNCGVTPVAVECLFNLMFYSDHQLQDQGLSLLQTAVMVFSRDYVGDIERVVDLIWLLLYTVHREEATALAPQVISAALTGADKVGSLSLSSVHHLLKRCYHLIRVMTTEAWIKSIIRSALPQFCQVCISAISLNASSVLSQVGDLAFILFKRFGLEEIDLPLVLFPALMTVSQNRSVMSALRTGMETAVKVPQCAKFLTTNCSVWYQSALSFGCTIVAEGSWHDWLTHYFGIAQTLLSIETAFVIDHLEPLVQLLACTFQQAMDQNLSKMTISLCRTLAEKPLSQRITENVYALVASVVGGLGRVHMTSLVAVLHLLLRLRTLNFAGFREGLVIGLQAAEYRGLPYEDKEAVVSSFSQVDEGSHFILKEMLFELRSRAEGCLQGKSLTSIAKKIGNSTPKSRKELVLIEC